MAHRIDPLQAIYRTPGYLPYPNPVGRNPGNYMVPNASSVDWPQAQLAPPYLPPGSASFSPYQYQNWDSAQVLYAGADTEFEPSGGSSVNWPKVAMIAGVLGAVAYALKSMSEDQAY
jgi:hypothetical protein